MSTNLSLSCRRKKIDSTVARFLKRTILLPIFWAMVSGAGAIAVEYEDSGNFTFDIRNAEDMRLVATLSGLTVKRDIPPKVGVAECARWARRFGIRPFEAVASATIPNRRARVWVCIGNADNELLSRSYCRQMQMKYVSHEGPVVTCRIGKDV